MSKQSRPWIWNLCSRLLSLLAGVAFLAFLFAISSSKASASPYDPPVAPCEIGIGDVCLISRSDESYGYYVQDMNENMITGVGWRNAHLLFFISLKNTINSPTVTTLSNAMLTIVDIMAGLAIAMSGIRYMIGSSIFRQQQFYEHVPRILLGLVLAHLTFQICAILIDFSMRVSESLYTTAQMAQNVKGSNPVLEERKSTKLFLHNLDKCDEIEQEDVKQPSPTIGGSATNWLYMEQMMIYTHVTKYGWESAQKETLLGYWKALKDKDAEAAHYKSEYDGIIHPDDRLYSIYVNPKKLQDKKQAENEFVQFDPEHRTVQKGKYYFCKDKGTDAYEKLQKFYIGKGSLYGEQLAIPSIDDINKQMDKLLELMFHITVYALLVQVLLRIFFVNLYLITAPFAFSMWALPGKIGVPVTRMWLQGFIPLVMVQFIQGMGLILIQILLGTIADYMFVQINGPSGQDSILRTVTLIMLLHIIFNWFIIRIPGLFNSTPMRTMVEGGQAAANALMAGLGMMYTINTTNRSLDLAKTGFGIQVAGAVASLGLSPMAMKRMPGAGKLPRI